MSRLLIRNPGIASRITRQLSSYAKKKMPAFTLYGARGSTNTDRVRLTLAEGGFTDYELVLLDLQKGEQKSKAHTSLNPFCKIPVLVSTSPSGEVFTLYESRAICKYLASSYSFPLLPSTTTSPPSSNPSNPSTSSSTNTHKAEALFDQSLSIESHHFSPPASTIAFEKFAKRFIGLPCNEAVVADSLRSLHGFFDIVEGILETQDYMAGEEFSLVDIFYIPLIQRLFVVGFGEELVLRRKNVGEWWGRVVGRPGIKALLDADREAVAKAGK